ncbi:glycoside hydrolase family 2 TIM barrel-domain containing protein [Sphingobacterium haloxyli]|uniref:Beta-galactosidase n=1 Tax=Sphingobacterium haloxyli TaxID=2100533 RepID=A0A2S9J8Z8_9SPHI|nr:glycoside hydrolase family 2 TIM barrel-domain containing protein [Sphingobacterium haloxyli]PRD49209.1 beta-galactosidase [Sphingobacterium haloxyli]
MLSYEKIFSLLLAVLLSSPILQAQVRSAVSLEKGWKFHKGEIPGAESNSIDDANWEQVVVPHDWAIKGPFDKEIDKQVTAIEQNGEKIPTEKTGRTGSLPYIGVGWYRLVLPEVDVNNKKATLVFDGAMSDAQVYINGQKVGSWAYGYNSFHFDITPYLHDHGQNLLAVRLENKGLSSRWYPGAGIYRPVNLVLSNPSGVKTWGMFVKTPIANADYARINIRTELEGVRNKNLKIITTITDQSGRIVAQRKGDFDHVQEIVEDNIDITKPKRWSPEDPFLYSAKIEIYENDRLLDMDSTRFGIRDVQINAKGGFMLNGKSRKLKGVCLHHDLGPLGAALNKAALRRQLQIMKDMGADAIRTAHNMPSPWQMDLCDELGLMVIAESFDEWKYAKVKNGYNRLYDEWVEKDLVNLIRRHRNHPSIVMWSIGNEVPEQRSADGGRMVKLLQDICHREDPTRLVTVGMDRVDNAIANGFAAVLDVPGLNYRTHLYETAYGKLPQGFILGSETASTVSSRGVYKFPAIEGKEVKYDDGQSSSYDLESCSWSNLPEDDWILQDDKSWVIGEFVWTGFDYLGEPTPYDGYWPSRSSYFGICDLAGLPKDRYYLYKSRWDTVESTLHILPHWTWDGKDGDTIPVYCYSSYPEAELFVNGVSQGKRRKDPLSRLDRYRLRWNDVVYQPGTIKVVAYDAQGEVAESKTVHTASKPTTIYLKADKTELDADGNDLAFVTVEIRDEEGNLCPHADLPLRFEVEGAGIFKAVCNGDATSLEMFHEPKMNAFNGKLVVLVQSVETSGTINLKVKGPNLNTASIRMTAR